MIRRTGTTLVVVFLAMLVSTSATQAQTFQGRVKDREDRSIATAMVRLLDEGGEPRGVAIADSEGFYELEAPGPGTYRLEAARIGYKKFVTAAVSATSRGGLYSVSMTLDPAPVALEGITVETQREDTRREMDRQIRLVLGVSPSALRNSPMQVNAIMAHARDGRGLSAALQRTSRLGLTVRQTTAGPCFSLRGQDCLPVFLDGARVNRSLLDQLQLEMFFSIVLVTPADGVSTYPGGALLLYTEAWVS
ncbi:MAG: carboxypeptidase-like regulatory domain-containing protein [Gemmatimonadetes bacterium]|nr:carboxypeptidase-like regulatory domain-containing protein [Gemmatimonadota bacterium]MDA1102461.1 carboxypeptidase-like regulatory domain-containing protein [Gemmatimonadota bacterium]